jgi:hypothetical protein
MQEVSSQNQAASNADATLDEVDVGRQRELPAVLWCDNAREGTGRNSQGPPTQKVLGSFFVSQDDRRALNGLMGTATT